MSIYFNIIGIRKYVIKKVIYNIGNTIPWACYQLEINRKTCEKQYFSEISSLTSKKIS